MPVYKFVEGSTADDNKLCVSKFFMPLKAVFSTPDTYISGDNIPDEEIPSKVWSTYYRSRPSVIPGCEYLSWEQISPTLGSPVLSWVITTGSLDDRSDIIQFLTSQISYRIDWTFTGIATVTNPQKISYVNVIPPLLLKFKAWDINGNDIVLDSPVRVGQKTSGTFVVPGQYGQFSIFAPDRNIVAELRVTGFIDPPDKYAVDNGEPTPFFRCGLLEYTNAIINPLVSMIKRTPSPTLATLEALVVAEYRRDAFLECIVPTTLNAEVDNSHVVLQSLSLFNPDGTRNPANPRKDGVCGYSWTAPSVVLVEQSGNIHLANDGTQNQFLLRLGKRYKIAIDVYGTSPSLEDYIRLHSGTPPNIVTDIELCNESLFNISLLLGTTGSPLINYVQVANSDPPPGGDGHSVIQRLNLGRFTKGVREFYTKSIPGTDGAAGGCRTTRKTRIQRCRWDN